MRQSPSVSGLELPVRYMIWERGPLETPVRSLPVCWSAQVSWSSRVGLYCNSMGTRFSWSCSKTGQCRNAGHARILTRAVVMDSCQLIDVGNHEADSASLNNWLTRFTSAIILTNQNALLKFMAGALMIESGIYNLQSSPYSVKFLPLWLALSFILLLLALELRYVMNFHLT